MEALSQLFVTESSTPTELARHLHLTTPSVTDLVDRLVSGGLVVRSSHPTDRRKIVVTLSATARSKMEDMFAVVTDVTLRATETLTPAERTIVIDCLASVSDAYEETIAAMTAGPGGRFAAHIASPAAVPPGPP
ncbi:MarR family transcriptional regulator [Pseudonocardia sp. KRD-169]|uniref:MarR family transcriptional regulator n=2 Tax=Pseudonocardia abyssalis TaxID=2792008 RepID=A0ABS6UYF7_9PSEU|nr:MarR family transcriptional regulator [Pseudonocardia abyssalis]MBW0137247.1 MarR family transcriptional regulator [Pseudonocardia abyssalis]